jgi:hypothetical protein
MRDNKVEYNGYNGRQYWQAIYAHVERYPSMHRVISGTQSAINMLIGNTWIERVYVAGS